MTKTKVWRLAMTTTLVSQLGAATTAKARFAAMTTTVRQVATEVTATKNRQHAAATIITVCILAPTLTMARLAAVV